MQTESILSTLLAAAAFLKHAVQGVASQAVRDAYEATKTYLRKKFVAKPDATRALELATEKPESLIRKALLAEESSSSNLGNDPELSRLIENLAALLPPPANAANQNVRVTGHRNVVQVAGRDLIHTTKLVRRNTITPDEGHLTVEQRERIREVAGELADRLAGDDGKANFAAVHRMLQRQFQVASYLLIPRIRYDEALSFLRQHRAINRSHLRGRNPVAYQNDFYRAIFAGARELGWHGEQVYRFATEKLALKTPVVSLKALGPTQLKAVAELIQRELRTMRASRELVGAAKPG
ncbi:MAG TPA: ORF6C domain-containing protein [Lacunisphaera sp.]|nr:ORF6C domain-containing protein [Lacunisphaera sp.]